MGLEDSGMKITLSDLILFATFLALLWYAWETRKMRREIVEQTKLQLTPFVVVLSEDPQLTVANYGESTARNIQIKCSSLVKNVPTPLPISALPKGEKKGLEIKSSGGFTALLTIDFKGAEEIHFELEYANIFEVRYQTKGILTSAGFSVTEFRKK